MAWSKEEIQRYVAMQRRVVELETITTVVAYLSEQALRDVSSGSGHDRVHAAVAAISRIDSSEEAAGG